MIHVTGFVILILSLTVSTTIADTNKAARIFSIPGKQLGSTSFKGTAANWVECPTGEIIAGFKNPASNTCQKLHCLEGIQCVKPMALPPKTRCYVKDIALSFNQQAATAECDDGYFINGLYSWSNDDLHCGLQCIEALKCCQYDPREIWWKDSKEDPLWENCIGEIGNKWCTVSPLNFVSGLKRDKDDDNKISSLKAAKVRELQKSTAVKVDNYAIIPVEKTWDEAQAFCQEKYRSDLATITTDAQIKNIQNAMKFHELSNKHAWIGLNDKGTEGTWTWKSGKDCKYVNKDQPLCKNDPHWKSGEPNEQSNNEDCVEMAGDTEDFKVFSDRPCQSTYYFICNVAEFSFDVEGRWQKVPSCVGCSENEYKITVGMTNVKEEGSEKQETSLTSETTETNWHVEASVAVSTFFADFSVSGGGGGSNSMTEESTKSVTQSVINSIESGKETEFTIKCEKDAIYQFVTHISQSEEYSGIKKIFDVNNPDYICLPVGKMPKCGPSNCKDQECQTCLTSTTTSNSGPLNISFRFDTDDDDYYLYLLVLIGCIMMIIVCGIWNIKITRKNKVTLKKKNMEIVPNSDEENPLVKK